MTNGPSIQSATANALPYLAKRNFSPSTPHSADDDLSFRLIMDLLVNDDLFQFSEHLNAHNDAIRTGRKGKPTVVKPRNRPRKIHVKTTYL